MLAVKIIDIPLLLYVSCIFSFTSCFINSLGMVCQIPVDPIIGLGIENDDLEEDLTWTDDEEDVRVDNMVRLSEQGFEFSNEMFKGGCIPTEMEVAQKKQKRAPKSKAVRGRKGLKPARANAGVRRNQRSPSV